MLGMLLSNGDNLWGGGEDGGRRRLAAPMGVRDLRRGIGTWAQRAGEERPGQAAGGKAVRKPQ